MKYGVKNFISIADKFVNSEPNTFEGIEKRLIAWFCFQYNTTPNDSRLLDMTLEELLVLYYMFKIKEDPTILNEVDGGDDDYEKWLKTQMGDSYVTEEQMSQEMINYEKEEKELAKALPDTITTDFSNIKVEE